MGTTFAQGQLAQLGSIVNIGTATALPKVAAKYDPKRLLKALDGRGEIFAGHLEAALEQAFNSMLDLAPYGTVGGTLTERHDPDAFFQTREGLWVSEDFRRLVVAKARPVEAGTVIKADAADLTRDMTDAEIEAALATSHLFEESIVCALIAHLIAKQSNGEEGPLLNNGYAILFYLGSCVVRVRWHADHREWSVDTWQRGDHRWRAGSRVFSPGN